MPNGHGAIWGDINTQVKQDPFNQTLCLSKSESMMANKIQSGFEHITLGRAVRILIRSTGYMVASVLGSLVCIAFLVLALMSRTHFGVAVTWGMVSLWGLSVPILLCLRILDVGVRIPSPSSTGGTLEGLP